MNTEEVNELLEAAKPAVIEALKEELKGSVTYTAKQACLREVESHTKEWVKENLIPEITKSLIEGKEGMISIASQLGPKIVDEIVKAMLTSVSENLKNSWDRKKLFEALLQ